jgi:CheY-like chemotaxis protein
MLLTPLSLIFPQSERILAAGFDGYISKPVDENALVALLQELSGVQPRGSQARTSEKIPTRGRKAMKKSHDENLNMDAEKLLNKIADEINAGNPVDSVVDDIHANVFMVESMLQDAFSVAGCENATEIWQVLKARHPRLLLLDIMMPFESGFSLLEKLSANEDYKDLPIIVVSAKDTREDVIKAMSLGANDYVVKPVKEDILKAKINKTLGIV